MIAAFRRLLRRITPAEVAAKELADAELSLLEAQTAHEYAAALIGYHTGRIARLRKFLATLERTK